MTISYITSSGAGNSGSSPHTTTYGAALAIGNVGVAFVTNNSGSGAFTVSDNLNGSYTELYSYYSSALGYNVTLWWVVVNTAGTPTITVTGTGGYFQVSCSGFSGFLGTPTSDTAIQANYSGSSTTSISISTITSNYNNELMIVTPANNITYIPTAPTGWGTGYAALYCSIQSTAGTNAPFNGTFAASCTWDAIVAGIYDNPTVSGPVSPLLYNRKNVLYFI